MSLSESLSQFFCIIHYENTVMKCCVDTSVINYSKPKGSLTSCVLSSEENHGT